MGSAPVFVYPFHADRISSRREAMYLYRSGRDREATTAWDEHRWEKLMKEQEQKAEEYLALLEKYAGHPRREEMVVQEVSWPHPCLLEESSSVEAPAGTSSQWPDEDLRDAEPMDDDEDLPALREGLRCEKESWERLRDNPAYRRAHEFCCEIHQFLPDGKDGRKPPRPIVDLMSHAYGVSARLAGGLGGSDVHKDLGMTIAYLKRGLGEIHSCLGTLLQIEDDAILPQEHVVFLRNMALEVREELVTQLAVFRRRWRDRHGGR
jgi:hypothetical protein